MRYDSRYVLGLDLGVASIGWAAVSLGEDDIPTEIKDHGVVIFRSLDNDKGKLYNQVRREKRGQRRVIRRRKERIRRIKNLILDTFSMSEADYEKLFHMKGQRQDNDIRRLNIYGLENKLSEEQLIRVLINYAKSRGFKSNRKLDTDDEKGKMKEAIGNIAKIMKENDCTVSKAMLIHQERTGLPVNHNTDTEDGYNYGYDRADVLKEIEMLLDKQISCGLIDEEFKDKYIDIWSSQRDYSDGPENGPYHVDFRKTFGICGFDHKYRISRACPSFERFTLIDKLYNLRYNLIDSDGNYIKDGKKRKSFALSQSQITDLYEKTINSKTNKLSFRDIKDKIKESISADMDIEIVDLPRLSKKEYAKLYADYRKKNDIANDVKLNDAQNNEVRGIAQEARSDLIMYEMKSYNEFKKQLKKLGHEELVSDIAFLDDAATVLSFAKTDKKIEQVIKEEFDNKYDEEKVELIKNMSTKISGTGSLSLPLVRDLIGKMLEGLPYDQAMKALNLDHSKREKADFGGSFPTIEEIEKNYDTVITNPNVKHTLVYLRRLYNAIVERYGIPYRIHIELARDISKSFSARNELRKEQQENYASKQRAKLEMFEALGLSDIEKRTFKSYSSTDILKFQLWEEQDHRCIYTGQEITRDQVLASNELNIDHILPFSRSFDDSYSNKVLVFTKANEEKKNRTPYEWLGSNKAEWNRFKERVEKNGKISQKKKNNLLTQEEVTFDEFSPRSLAATTYMSKLALKIFCDLLNTDDEQDNVRAFKGGATSFLRKYYRLNQYTHSYESENYLTKDTKYVISSKDIEIKKERNSVKISVKAKNKYDFAIEYSRTIVKKDGKDLSKDDHELYDMLWLHEDRFIEYMDQIITGKDIDSIEDSSMFDDVDIDDSVSLAIVKLAYDIVVNLKAELISKNRDNHLHHEVDAILIATMTRSMQLKITRFSKMMDTKKGKFIDDNGEVFDNIDELTRHYNVDTSNKNRALFLPQPYDGFIKELVIKVFERDEDTLNKKLSELYGRPISDAKVKYPSYQADKKVSGALHAETILGTRLYEGKEVTVKRVLSTTLKKSDIEKIYDGDRSQKPIKEALEKWFDMPKAEKTKYPMHPYTGEPIKKVKILATDINKTISISQTSKQKGRAEIGSVARIQIYKKEGEDKLYFVQLSIDKYLKRKSGDLNFDVQMWYGQSSKNFIINYNDILDNGYKLYRELYPGQIINVEMNSGASSLAIATGFTSGKFEIKSILGDQLDLVKGKLINKYNKQNQLTVSAFKYVDPVKIDIMGYLQK